MGRNKYIWAACAIIFVVVGAGGCGSTEDEGSPAPAGQGGAGGTSGVGGTGGGGTGGGVAVMPLPPETAGKTCTSDTECAPGTCATMVTGLDGELAAAPGGYCMGACMTSTDCGSGGTCVPDLMTGAGQCYESCAADTDCRPEYLCGPLTSTCRPKPPTDQLADNVAGIACAADPDCGDGVCLTMLLSGAPFPGGYCSGACLEDAHCGAGGLCLAATGRCYDICATDPDCTRDGYRCRELGEMIFGCLPYADPLPDNTTGLACATDAECAGVMGACATMLPAAGGGEIAAPGGYCTATCEIDADCGAGGLCVSTREGGRCMKPCAMETECREGFVCGPRGFGDMPPTVCTPFEPTDGGTEMPDAAITDGGM